MIISPLAKTVIISPNKSIRQQNKYYCKIDTITIHVMAGNLSVETCGNVFKDPKRQASSNYGVDSKGNIACYVPEEYRSWATSNKPNDYRAITIEVANDKGKQTGYHVTDTALNSLVTLIADICKRNGIKKLIWSDNKNNRVNHLNGCNMTVHRDYAAKACPGDYLMSKHPWIAESVNNLLAGTPVPAPAPSNYIYENIDYTSVFDPVFYSNKYSDLKAAFGNNATLLFNHFIKNGMKEARQAITTFDPKIYRQKYPDLNAAFGNNWEYYYKHYCTIGRNEGRTGI